jgi:hypothetical protein
MTDKELQEAVDKARVFVASQMDYKTTPSADLKDYTIRYIKELQAIQVVRAGLAYRPTLKLQEKDSYD